MRLAERVAMVVGGGQTPGDTIGNGRAMALLFAREGARVVVADRDLASAEQTVALIAEAGGQAVAQRLDITDDAACQEAMAACKERFGQLDVLVNNVGIGTGDSTPGRITDEAWDRIYEVNVKGAMHTCRHAVPLMRERGTGSIINISSIASIAASPLVAYKTSKAAMNALTETLAMANAKHGVRVNAILPGLMNTPMAIESIAKASGVNKEALIEERNRRVPLKGGMGSAWDVAHAALFLASDEARFITGVLLPVDGGQSVRIG